MSHLAPTVVVSKSVQAERHDAAAIVVAMLQAAGWTDDEVLARFDHDTPEADHAYEQDQIHEFGEVRVTAAEMRAEIRQLLTN